MNDYLPTSDDVLVQGTKTGFGPGYTLEAIAVRISHDITRARERGDLPKHTRTVVTVLPTQRTLHIRVEGFDTDPGKAANTTTLATLFDLASDHNIISLDPAEVPLFTQHIVLVDPFGQPFAAMVGAGIGHAETITPLYVPPEHEHP